MKTRAFFIALCITLYSVCGWAAGIQTDGAITKDPNSSTNQTITTPTISGGTIDNTVIGGTTPAAGTFTVVKWAKCADFTGATIDLATCAGNVADITTDTTTISTFGTVASGATFFLRFTSARDLTYNVTSMILPGSRTITTTAGDTAIFESLGSGNWLCHMYRKADGRLLGDLVTVTLASTRNLTVNEMTGGTVLVTGAYTGSVPAADGKRKAKFMATTAAQFCVDVATGTDVIYLGQTAQAAGEKVCSDGTVRATIYCESTATGYYDCTPSRGVFINGGS